jgi:hypothetical protein
VETAVIEKPPVGPTSADVKTEQLPNLEDRATNAAPAPALVSEEPTAIGQATHSQDPATGAEETKVESPVSEDLTKASTNQSELLPNDLKTEQVHAAEEPVAANDIKTDSTNVEPIKDDRPIAVDQISVPVSNSGDHDDVKTDPVQHSEERNTAKDQGSATPSLGTDKDSAIKTEGSSVQESTKSTSTPDIQPQSRSIAPASQEPPAQADENKSPAPASKESPAQADENKSTAPAAREPLTQADENRSTAPAPAPEKPAAQATPVPKSRGISSPEHPPAATDTKDLPPQPSSETEQQPPKGTSSSKSSPCTIM